MSNALPGYDNWITTGGSRTCTHCGKRFFASDGGCGSCADEYSEWEMEAMRGLSNANVEALVDIGEFTQVGSRTYWFGGEGLWENGCEAEDAAEMLTSILMDAFQEAV
jgi:hypothetical protein